MYRDFNSYSGQLSKAWLQEEVIHCDYPAAYKLPRRYAFRYLKICVIETSQPVTITNLKAIATTSADYNNLEPLCNNVDKLLVDIDRIAQKTLSECMQTVYEDGPKRDRRLWIGDLRLQALTDYYLFKNYNLVKRCLYMIAYGQRSDGQIPSCIFEKPQIYAVHNYHLIDYSLLFVVAVNDYFQHTSDIKTATDLFDTAKNQINIGLSCLDSNGIMTEKNEWWAFIDWCSDLKHLTAMQGVLLYALENFVSLANALGKIDTASIYEAKLKKLKKLTKEKMYDVSRNAFINNYDDNQYSVMSQVWMILGNVIDENKAKTALINSLGNAIKPVTPYAHHYVVEAMIKLNMMNEAKQYIINYWGKMVKNGADTFWEVFDEKNPSLSPYGDDVINSSCHAWSCSPSYFIRKYFNKLT